MSKMTILVCLYNKSISTSDTLKSLLKSVDQIKDQDVFIWDNSVYPLEENDIDLLKNNFKILRTNILQRMLCYLKFIIK